MKNIMFIVSAGLGVWILLAAAGCCQKCKEVALCRLEQSARVIRSSDVEAEKTEWGSLQWLVSANNKASENITLGRVTFKPGQANPPHFHPNCEEVLYVVSGAVEHTLPQGGTAILNAGDCIVLPKGSKHSAKNTGTEEAVVIVAFDSAYRQTQGE